MKSMDWTGWDRLIHLTDKHPTKWLRLFRLNHQSYSKFKLVLFTSLFYKGRVDTPRIDPVMFSTSEYYLESTLSLSTEVPHLERECRGIPSGLTCFRILRSFAQKEARKHESCGHGMIHHFCFSATRCVLFPTQLKITGTIPHLRFLTR